MSETWIFCQFCGTKASGTADSHQIAGSSLQASADNASSLSDATTKPLSDSPDKQQGETDHSTVPIPIEPKAYSTVPIQIVEQEDAEERRRRIAMLDPDFAAPDEEEQTANSALPISPLADITTHENIPQVAGTPQVTNAVQIQGAPQFRGSVAGYGTIPQPYPSAVPPSGTGHNAGLMSSQLSAHMPAARRSPETPLPPSIAPQATPSLRDQKWLRIGLISGLVLVIFLLGGMALTLISSTPALSLDGGTTVAQGDTLHLSGNHFLSGGTVILTLDHTTPLYSAYHNSEEEITSNQLYTINTLLLNNRITQRTLAGNTIKVSKDGSFHVNIQVGLDWRLGDHSIQANEGSGARIASLSFTVTQPTPVPSEEKVTPITTTTITPTTKTDTPASPDMPPPITAVVTPPTLVTSGLSGVAPGLLTFGPANEGDQQVSTAGVVLATTGTALITWNATWDQKQAPWLQMKPTTGQIQAPASQKIAVSASPANLKAGTYKALITFTNTLNAQTVTLNVVLTIQASCLKATPTSLAFTSTVGAADPAPQTVTINACGQADKWSATTSANSAWLSVKPTSGAIAQNGTQDITVAATSQKLAAGSYQGQIVLSNGSVQVTIPVTLTIQSAPQLAVSQSSIAVAKMCQLSAGTWTCTETLSSSSTQGSLAWTASSNASGTVTITPASGTIANGQTTSVSIAIPTASCAANFTLTFTGPANSVAVPIDCSNTQGTPQVK
jgi:hypothetical protein